MDITFITGSVSGYVGAMDCARRAERVKKDIGESGKYAGAETSRRESEREIKESLKYADTRTEKDNSGGKDQSDGRYDPEDFKSGMSEWVKRRLEEMEQKRQEDRDKKQNDTMLRSIRNKLYAGCRLTPAEKQYLQSKDPSAYERAESIDKLRRQYQNELRRCRTKEEVQRVRMCYAMSGLGNLRAVTVEKDSDTAEYEHQRISAINREDADYIRSGSYHALPTENERLKAAKDLRKAEEQERRKNSDAESKRRAENTVRRVYKKIQDKSANASDIEEMSEAKKLLAKKRNEKKMSRAKAESSPEARKVRRSNARAAYRSSSECPQAAVVRMLNEKA